MHETLYPRGVSDFPSGSAGGVFYIFVCRTCMGYPIRTIDGYKCIEDQANRDAINVWATRDQRELVTVPDVSPTVTYHSLVVETGAMVRRFREFLIFHEGRIYPEYLLAYHRILT